MRELRSRSVYGILERLASLEHRIVRSRDLDGFLGARIQAGTSRAGLDRERAEPDQVHRIAALERSSHRVDDGIERGSDRRQGAELKRFFKRLDKRSEAL